MKMTSKRRQTASSSENSSGQSEDKRQEATFLAIDNHRRANTATNNTSAPEKRQAMLFRRLNAVDRTVEDLKDTLEKKAAEELETVSKDINKKIMGLDEKVKNLDTDLNKKVLEARNKIIEPLAIFVGLFTFTSIGFQVFTQVKEYILWMPILGAVLGGLIIFAGLVVHASSVNADTKERRKYTGIIMMLGTLVLLSSGAYYYKAVDVLRAEDSKTCVLVQSSDQDAPAERYCKLAR
jgi:hypothetical protein